MSFFLQGYGYRKDIQVRSVVLGQLKKGIPILWSLLDELLAMFYVHQCSIDVKNYIHLPYLN
jgi:hypothetical protein